MSNKREVYFFQLDAIQAAVAVGVFEILSIISFYLGAVIGAVVLANAATNDPYNFFIGLAGSKFVARIGLLLLCALAPLIFPLLLVIGAVKRNRCMMMPWIIYGFVRVILGVYTFFIFLFILERVPMGSCAQILAFFSYCIYYAMTGYSLYAVYCGYLLIRQIEFLNLTQAETENLSNHNPEAAYNIYAPF